MKILIVSQFDPAAVERLRHDHDVVSAVGASPAELRERIRDREVLAFRSGVDLSASLLECAPDLKLIVRGGSGFDNIDMDYVTNREIAFLRIPEPGARAVAELTFALMLSLARQVVRADGQWRQGHWVKNAITGHLLRGKVLGIVGAGNIGSVVGELGTAWGMDAIGCTKTPANAPALLAKGIKLATFDQVVARADFLTLHVPLTADTRHLIDASVLARMKRGAFLINLARGGVVDEAALREALVSGHLSGAALDVHEAEGEGRISPLADLPNAILTPHIGATTLDTAREIGERLIAIVTAFAAPATAAGDSQSAA